MSRTILSPKQAKAWRLLDRPEIVEVFAGGSAGGGKSWLGCLRQIYRRTTFAETRGFIGRRDYTALRDSTMKTYFDLLRSMGYQSGQHYTYNAQEHIVYFANGSEQHFRHMAYQPSDPDYNRFGSTEYTDAFIDEAPEVHQRAAEILLSRLRLGHTKHGITPELLLTGNPGDHWIKARYVMDTMGNMIDLPEHRARVLFTVADNPDETFRANYTRTLNFLDDYDRARLLYGDWTARANIERPFATAFTDRNIHPCEYERGRMLHISMDFNLDPMAFIYAHVWTDHSGPHVHIFDEETVPNASIDEACTRIIERFGMANLAMVTLTGDYNGNTRNLMAADGRSIYSLIQKRLNLTTSQLDLRPNPRHINSRHDVNFAIRNIVDFRIDPKCVHLARDLRTVEVDAEGSIIKANRKDTAQLADHLDALRYLVNGKEMQSIIKALQV